MKLAWFVRTLFWSGLGLFSSTITASAWGQDFDLSGFVAGEVRVFPQDPAFADQRDFALSPSIALQPELRYDWNGGDDRLTAIPFLRLDADDDERSHGDLREFSWYHAEGDWDILAGVGKVFWGVAESRHLVDIINQTDLVESPDGEDKLGQPMVNGNLQTDWGTFSVFVLPGFRERTFPGDKARLRGALPIEDDDASYESGAEEYNIDFAARWAHSLGDWDLGLAQFHGTGREPRFIKGTNGAGQSVLRSFYDIIDQTSVDAQYTTGAWLFKLEALTRSGQGEPFFASVAGFEYTLFQVFDSSADLGLLAEYLYDGRDSKAPATIADDDFFIGTRLALNDTDGTQLLLGAVIDRESQATALSMEAERRLPNDFKLEIEGRLVENVSTGDPLYGTRRDNFIEIRLSKYF